MNKVMQHLKDIAPMPTKNNATDNVITKEDATMAQANINVTTNNANAKENKMNREVNRAAKSAAQYAVQFQEEGNTGFFPTVGGIRLPMFIGGTDDADLAKGMAVAERAAAAANYDPYKTMMYLANACKVADAEIKPTEAVEIPELDAEFLIDYEKKAIYYYDDEKANLDDLDTTNWPNEAIKAMLVTRAKEKWEQEEEGADNFLDLLAGLM